MDKQGIFNKVYKHLLTQNKKSEGILGSSRRVCLYRGPDGTMCAVGCLIPDEKYAPDLEGKRVDCEQILDALGLTYGDDVALMLSSLQFLHDWTPVHEWASELRDFARRNNLTVPE